MRLAGKGIQNVSGYGYGDHYVHIRVDVPKDLDRQQKALIQAFAETEKETPGTVDGFTYDRRGKKVLMEDPDGIVAEIKEVFEEETKPHEKPDKNAG